MAFLSTSLNMLEDYCFLWELYHHFIFSIITAWKTQQTIQILKTAFFFFFHDSSFQISLNVNKWKLKKH